MQDLYDKPRFKDNQNYLLRRYTELEKKDTIWLNLCIPVFLTVMPSFWRYLYQQIVETAVKLEDASAFVSATDSLLYALYTSCIVGLIVLALFTIWSVIYMWKLAVSSLTRQPDSTLKENELQIIKSLLIEHKIFLDEQSTE